MNGGIQRFRLSSRTINQMSDILISPLFSQFQNKFVKNSGRFSVQILIENYLLIDF